MTSFHIILASFLVIALISPSRASEEKVNKFDDKKSVSSDESLTEAGRRNPRLGFNLVSFPNITFSPPGNNTRNGIHLAPVTPIVSATLGSAAILLKGIGALKAAIVPPLLIGALLIFLAAGAAFFACNIVDCGFGNSSHGTSYGGFSNPLYSLNRNSYDHYDQQQQQNRPVFQALEDGYKKY